jgi:nitroreductase
MDMLELIRSRRSIRSYQEREIPDDILHRIIDAAMTAPSAGNQQPWHFVIVRDRVKMEAVTRVHPYCRMITKAPLAVLVCGDPVGKKLPEYWVQDCSAAVQNLLLAARAEGVGSVWTGIYPLQERIEGCRKIFSVPDHIIPFAIIPMGWPKEENGFKQVSRFRAELVHQDQFEK